MGVEKDDDIKRLVKLIDPSNQNAEWLKTLFRDVTKIKESEWDRFLDEMDFNVVVALYYPIYDKYFTHDEIKELVKFYSSSIGIKLVQSKSVRVSSQFAQNELIEIEHFKKTDIGRKYNKLLNEITNQHVKSVRRYIESLR